jgi:hypothetical protein
MAVTSLIELAAGLILAGLTLRDVFDTVIVPGGSRASLRVARRLVFVMLPIWKKVRGPDRGLSTSFAPLTLVLSFAIWMGLLTLAFALMAISVRQYFEPALPDFSQALFVVGSGLVTVGLSETDATGPARWVVLGAGFCGLAVMTMAVTYLLEVQSSIARRDTGIFKLSTSAGEPPSALVLLEKFRSIGNDSHLADVLRDGRDWCAGVRQSHTSHPSLIYFRSAGTGSGWPAALGALLDLALIVELMLDLPETGGLAVLLREDGMRMGSEIGALLKLEPRTQRATRQEAEQLMRRLAAAGYPLRDGCDPDILIRARQDHAGWVEALAAHLGRASTPLLAPHA